MAKLLLWLWIIIKLPHIYTMAGLVTSVLIHGSVLIDVSKTLTVLVILCSLFSPPSHPFPMLLSSTEADPVDRINQAPYWLLVDLCFHLANRRNQQKEKERHRDRPSLEKGQRGEIRVHSPSLPCGSSSCVAPSLQGSGWQWLIASGLSQGASNLISFLPNSHL